MTRRERSIPNVLSIAGSDPGGGAGIQADLKTFGVLGCHGMAVPTALTAQNTLGVSSIHLPPPDFVAEQIRMVFDDIAVDAVKIGMLGSSAIVEAVARALSGCDVPIVLDPVLVATSGAALGDETIARAIRRHLVPLSLVVTPNLAEAASLVDHGTIPATREAAERIAVGLRSSGGAAAWLVKGGHGAGDAAEDCLADASGVRWYASPRLPTSDTHGTGCTLSSAIAAFLARGRPLRDAVAEAKAYVDEAIAGGRLLDVGEGPGPLDHFARLRPTIQA